MVDQHILNGIQRRGKKFQGLLAQVQTDSGSATKAMQQELEKLQSTVNAASKEIPKLDPKKKKQKLLN